MERQAIKRDGVEWRAREQPEKGRKGEREGERGRERDEERKPKVA